MKFKKGLKVEVLNEGEVPIGSWSCAEIISGNGHTYHVKFDHYSPKMGLAAKRVPRRAIRPRPPPIGGSRSWVPGDIVEVSENKSWKPAEVSRMVDGNCFVVTLLGSSREFRAHESDLRLLQSWKGNKWVVAQKECEKGADAKADILSELGKFSCQKHQRCRKVKRCRGDHFLCSNNTYFEEPCCVTSRGLKSLRTPGKAHRKAAPVEEGGKQLELAVGPVKYSSPLLEKVHAVASSGIRLGEKYVHASFSSSRVMFPELGMDRGKPDDDPVPFSVGSLKFDDSRSPTSSVGSCSPSRSPYRSSNHLKARQPQNTATHSYNDDALCELRKEHPLPAFEGSTNDIHRLEIYAYHATMAALHSSGPLSWEQEALLTNLRLTLHITIDEHLLELRQLANTKNDSA